MKNLFLLFFLLIFVIALKAQDDIDKSTIISLVKKWNDLHNNYDREELMNLYYGDVVYYTIGIKNNEVCINDKERVLGKKLFRQRQKGVSN